MSGCVAVGAAMIESLPPWPWTTSLAGPLVGALAVIVTVSLPSPVKTLVIVAPNGVVPSAPPRTEPIVPVLPPEPRKTEMPRPKRPESAAWVQAPWPARSPPVLV